MFVNRRGNLNLHVPPEGIKPTTFYDSDFLKGRYWLDILDKEIKALLLYKNVLNPFQFYTSIN
jgi:hypothetical protein